MTLMSPINQKKKKKWIQIKKKYLKMKKRKVKKNELEDYWRLFREIVFFIMWSLLYFYQSLF